MYYENGAWHMEYVSDLPMEKQTKLREEVREAYEYFGYRGKELEAMVEDAMEGEVSACTNLIGFYGWHRNQFEGER